MTPDVTKMISTTKQLSSLSRANGRRNILNLNLNLAHNIQVLTIKQQSSAKDHFSFGCGSFGSFISAGKIRHQQEHTPCLYTRRP